MKYGFFDDANAEYVITTPKTPLPWINYLGSNDFFSIFSSAKHLTLASAITSEDHVEIIAEYDIFSKLK